MDEGGERGSERRAGREGRGAPRRWPGWSSPARRRGSIAVTCGLAAWLAGATPAAAEDEPTPARPPLAESLLTESATDVDAREAGEIELEANGAALASARGGARAVQASLEVEWRALREVGVRVEPTFDREIDGGARSDTISLNGAIAVGLFHDFARDLHLQAELLGRTREATARTIAVGDAHLPYALDLVGAKRVDAWTFRATVGGEAGGAFAHAPLHTDLAVLTGWTPDARAGFFGLELRADWARQQPFVIAPDLVVDLTPLDVPLRIGVAAPITIAAPAEAPSRGLFLRLIWLTEREAAYGRGE